MPKNKAYFQKAARTVAKSVGRAAVGSAFGIGKAVKKAARRKRRDKMTFGMWFKKNRKGKGIMTDKEMARMKRRYKMYLKGVGVRAVRAR
jgi:hypothetical protein